MAKIYNRFTVVHLVFDNLYKYKTQQKTIFPLFEFLSIFIRSLQNKYPDSFQKNKL